MISLLRSGGFRQTKVYDRARIELVTPDSAVGALRAWYWVKYGY